MSQIKFDPSKYNFNHVSTEYIKDFNLTQHIFKHNKTETIYRHVQNSDQNNLFAIQFRTLPENHKGIPHILEHMALCGSKNFPVRDPFFKMIKRSLNTFMNAFTCPDMTCYPFSTQNEQDFKNLLNIYMDASLNPLLNENDFFQEGWRVDFEEKKGNQQNTQSLQNEEMSNQQFAKDSIQNLVFKGVVYNEMKGVYQNPQSFYQDQLINQLFPKDSVYSKMYGGNPNDIVSLKYQELKDFHDKYYHPSNAQILTYGNMNIESHMEIIDQYLDKFEKLEIDSRIKGVEQSQEIKSVTLKCPTDENALDTKKQTKFSLNYIYSPYETLCMNILNSLLFDSPNGALYKSLIESQKANQFSPGCGYGMFLKEGIISIGVDQISEDQINDIQQTINDTLQEKYLNGFDINEINAILHQVEIQNKMPKTNFGLSLLYSQMGNINHNVSLKDGLDLNNQLQKIRENIDKGLFQNLIKKYILDNKNCLKLKMIPDDQDNYQIQQNKIEKQYLERIQQKLTENDVKDIKEQNLVLKNEQDNKDLGIEKLPTLKISDINRQEQRIQFIKKQIGNSSLHLFEQETNGLTFLRIKIDAKNIKNQQIANLFCKLFTSLGTKDLKHDIFQQKLNRYTTNFNISFNSEQQFQGIQQTDDYYLLSIACLDQNIDQMFSLLKQIFTEPDFLDSEHIINLTQQIGSGISENIQESPLNFGINYAASGILKSKRNLNMINQSRFLNQTCKKVSKKNDDLSQLQQDLNNIHQQFLFQDKLSFSIHSNSKNFENIENQIGKFTEDLKKDSDKNDILQVNEFQSICHKHFFELPLQVNYCTEIFETPHYQHPDSSKMHILSYLFQNTFLHKEIREKGGAYGSGCKYSPEGYIAFFSYRDPNHFKTYDVFQKSIDYILNEQIDEQEMQEAKLCLFQRYDSLVSPQKKGLDLFLSDITQEQKQQYREMVLDSQQDDIKMVCEKYLKNKNSSKVIFGGSEHVQLFNDKNDGWVIEKPIQ